MSKAPRSAKPGLGTSIIEALARQLGARVDVADAAPGTAVSLVHDRMKTGRGDQRRAETALAV